MMIFLVGRTYSKRLAERFSLAMQKRHFFPTGLRMYGAGKSGKEKVAGVKRAAECIGEMDH